MNDQPSLRDMVGATIDYVYARPYGLPHHIERGTITEVREYKGILYMTVEPDDPRLFTKEKSEIDFVRYIHTAEVAHVA